MNGARGRLDESGNVNADSGPHLAAGALPAFAGEGFLEHLLRDSGLLVSVKDQRLRYLRMSAAMEAQLELAPGEALGRTVHDVLPPDAAARFWRLDHEVLDSGRATQDEEQFEIGGVRRSFIATRLPLADREGRICGVCTISTDITERKGIESALRDVALGVSAVSGQEVFRQTARYLCRALDVDLAFVSVIDETSPGTLKTLALHVDGEFQPNVNYEIEGTPCRNVLGQAFVFVPDGLTGKYADEMARELGLVSYAGYPLFDSAGRATGVLAVGHRRPLREREVTEATLRIFAVRAAAELERQRADRARAISEASYREIFEAAEDAVFVHDVDTGAIVDVNPKACEVYGYTRDELLSLDAGRLSSGEPPYTAEHAARLIARAGSGEVVRTEWRRRNRDGSLHWDEVVLKRATLAGHARVLAFTRDITERKQAEQNLRAREEQYRAIFDTAVDGLLLLNAEGRLVDANPAFCGMHGYTHAELKRMDPRQFIHPEYWDQFEAFLDSLRTGEPFRCEARDLRKDGSAFDVEVSGVRLAFQGEPHLMAIVRDITERRRAESDRNRLEAQLRQAQKMEAIGHLTGGIAHDFNNILTGILGYTVLAREQQDAGSADRLPHYLEQIQQSGERARDLIRQMLTFSRGQRGEPRAMSLSSLAKGSVRLFGSTFPSTIELRTDLAPDLPAVMLDPVQAEQVVMNLCINARDAMAEGGVIEIAARPAPGIAAVCSACRKPVRGDFVELRVSDTGPGIEPEIAERMFEPFFTTKEVGKGSGMGLATVHGIVHDHGGHVVLESRPGRGAAFRILFPAARGAAGPDPRHEGGAGKVARPRREGRVLLADDEVSVREFMRELLESRGFRVTAVADGRRALAAVRDGDAPYDLVITDQTMPHLTGMQLAGELRSSHPGLPVVLYTGYSDSITEQATLDAGIGAFLRKPVDVPALFEAIERLVEARGPEPER